VGQKGITIGAEPHIPIGLVHEFQAIVYDVVVKVLDIGVLRIKSAERASATTQQ
jgi:hypothetical protein